MRSTTVLVNQLEQERKSLARAGRMHWFHWVIVAFSGFLTIAAWYFSKSQVEEAQQAQFDREFTHVAELVSERMRTYEDALWSGVAAIEAGGGEMTLAEWRTFAASLHIETKYPGINGIGIVYHVAPEDMAAHLEQQQGQRPGYRVHPEHSENEHFPIVFIEPEAPNAEAVGLDMAYETSRYSAARRARDTGEAQFTGPIVLAQDEGHTPGFLFYVPYYLGSGHASLEDRRANFVGMVYAPFVVT